MDEKDWDAIAQRNIADLKKSSKAMVEYAAVRATQKVMAEFNAQSDERPMEPSPEYPDNFIDALKYDVAKREMHEGNTL